jgi:hypothetical protein
MPTYDPSKLDLPQILQRVFDEQAGKLRVETSATIGNVSINVDIDAATGDNVAIADFTSGAKLKINSDGSINVSLPPVSATSASIQNIVLPTAGSEVGILLPNHTRKFQLKIRDNEAKLNIAFVATETSTNYITIPRGCNYSENDLDLTTINRVLYVRSDKSNAILECIAWA